MSLETATGRQTRSSYRFQAPVRQRWQLNRDPISRPDVAALNGEHGSRLADEASMLITIGVAAIRPAWIRLSCAHGSRSPAAYPTTAAPRCKRVPVFSPSRSSHGRRGLWVVAVPAPLIDQAVELAYQHPTLRICDCCAFMLAGETADSVALDSRLPAARLAETRRIEVHDVSWAVDQMHAHGMATPIALRGAI